MTGNTDQIGYWNEVAGAKWVAGQPRLDAMMAPLTTALLAAAAVRSGEAVLDVGCGCGETALRCAEAAGRSGDVLAIDVSEPMLAHARIRAAELIDSAPIRWLAADAAAQRFDADRDLVLSRFGVMFFADRLAGLANLRHAASPGGRVAFLTWRHRDEVEWMRAPAEWLVGLAEVPASDESLPGPFAFGDGAATCRLLEDAGFHDVMRTPIDRALRIGADVDDAVELLLTHGPAAGLVREGVPALRREAEAVLGSRLRAFQGGDGVALGAACWLYTARC